MDMSDMYVISGVELEQLHIVPAISYPQRATTRTPPSLHRASVSRQKDLADRTRPLATHAAEPNFHGHADSVRIYPLKRNGG